MKAEDEEEKKKRGTVSGVEGAAHLHHHTLSLSDLPASKSHTSHISFLIRAKGEVAYDMREVGLCFAASKVASACF
jgi:hypothetical protein